MKSAKLLSVVSLSSILMMACQSAAQSQIVPSPSPPPYVENPAVAPATPPTWPEAGNANVQAIEQAPDPSSAIQAYAFAHEATPNDVGVEQAYVRRMVAFGLPEMAESQANDVTQHRPTDGVAWAVRAYMSAKRDQTADGLASVAVAAKYSPQDPFVLRTAGQLVAWYDARVDKGQVSADTRNTVTALKSQLGAKTDYADAYSHAVAEYGKLGADAGTTEAAPTAESAAAIPPDAPAEPLLAPDYSGAYSPGYAAASYAAPAYVAYPDPYYVVNPYDPYAYWYPTPYWGADWWWPSFGAFIVIDNDFRFHHRDFDHDRDDFRGRFDRDGRNGRFDNLVDRRWTGDRNRSTNTGTGANVARTNPRTGTTSSPANQRVWENRTTDPRRIGTATGSRTVTAPTGQAARVTAPAARTNTSAVRTNAQPARSITMPQARVPVSATPRAQTWTLPRSNVTVQQPAPRTFASQAPAPRFSGREFSSPHISDSGPRFSAPSGGADGFRQIGGGAMGGGAAIRSGGGGGHGGGHR